MGNETISIQPARMITPEKQRRMDADTAKPLPGAPPVKPAAQAMTPQEQAAASKAIRERGRMLKGAADSVLK